LHIRVSSRGDLKWLPKKDQFADRGIDQPGERRREPANYVRYLQENPHEIDMLFSELLISVTSFFRDPEAFEALCTRAIPELLESRPENQDLRVWVPGCASGEDAYSVAIVLQECMENLGKRWEVQIFGTDLDHHAIDAARAGIYAAGITADVSPERLERCFTRDGNICRIRKEIRGTISWTWPARASPGPWPRPSARRPWSRSRSIGTAFG
jgi:chemotaxis methyl-accepting protein methylase